MENYQLNPLLTENVARRLFRMAKNGANLKMRGDSGEIMHNLLQAQKHGKDFAKVAKQSRLADISAKRANNMANIAFKKGTNPGLYRDVANQASDKAEALKKSFYRGRDAKQQAKLITRDSSGAANPIHKIINKRAEAARKPVFGL